MRAFEPSWLQTLRDCSTLKRVFLLQTVKIRKSLLHQNSSENNRLSRNIVFEYTICSITTATAHFDETTKVARDIKHILQRISNIGAAAAAANFIIRRYAEFELQTVCRSRSMLL